MSDSECEDASLTYDSLCVEDASNYGYLHVPGVNIVDGKIAGSDKHIDSSRSIASKVLSIMEYHFGSSLKLVNFGYVQMLPGANNGLHADVSLLDGTPYPDGRHVDYSAIIYTNNEGIDFTGGGISFPNQGVSIKPRAGSLVIFPGDMDHLHSVKTVTSGIRKNIILFFEKR